MSLYKQAVYYNFVTYTGQLCIQCNIAGLSGGVRGHNTCLSKKNRSNHNTIRSTMLVARTLKGAEGLTLASTSFLHFMEVPCGNLVDSS